MTNPPLYSAALPKLQLAWDASSYRALMFCPRYYQLSILEGWRKDTVDLDFGTLAHGAMEVFDKALLEGAPFEDAQFKAVEYALMRSGTWSSCEPDAPDDAMKVWTPWGGRYETMWKCKGDVAYMKGLGKGKKKCPNSFVKVWMLGHGPTTCGECGGGVREESRWLPIKTGKDRHALIRLVAWWTEDLRNSPVRAIRLANGKAAVEVHFIVNLPWRFVNDFNGTNKSTIVTTGEGDTIGEPITLCGHLDGICNAGPETFVRERKTTKNGLDKKYWDGFSPNIQIDTYDIAAHHIPEMKELNIRGVLIEAAQTLESGARSSSHICYRTPGLRLEAEREMEFWLKKAEEFARNDYWPMAKSQCWLCGFKGICSKDPASREKWLKADFKQQHWNPMEER